jgi:lipopolysaccharide transport system ATP-binding protein
MEPAIRVEGVGKCYRVRQAGRRAAYRTLRESLTNLALAPFRNGRQSVATEDFWALQDVSFEVQPGEVVGIIGRNGAGKSTLLKVLSRITRPTTGQVELRGRVGSLLEVSTGFHPELTGRENVYLNGSILGMSRKEIDRRFDAIVAFAEVEKFLDTPVKRYSSGMYVRLAFAVAAHLEPEILLIDEVLAVGDARFQRRCLERMTELAQGGRALLFVSHNLDLISKFCRRTLLLERESVRMDGEAHRVTAAYLGEVLNRLEHGNLADRPRRGSGEARFTAIRFLDAHGRESQVIHTGEDLRCVLDIESAVAMKDVSLAVVVKTLQGTRLLTSWTEEVGYQASLMPGHQQFECRFEGVRLRPGRQVAVEVWMHNGDVVDYIEDACVLDVVELKPGPYCHRPDHGAVLYDYVWTERKGSLTVNGDFS